MHRVPLWKPLLILGVILLSLYVLYPSYRWHNLEPVEKAQMENQEMEALRAQISELQADKAEALAAGNDTQADVITGQIAELETTYEEEREALRNWRARSIHLGLDLQGGLRAVLQVDFEEMAGTAEERDINRQRVLESVIKVLDERINSLGLSETVTQVQGDDRVLVQIPGLADESMIYDVLGRTARLTFREVLGPGEVLSALRDIDESLGTGLSERVMLAGGGDYPRISADDYERFRETLLSEEATLHTPRGFEFKFGDIEGTQAEGQTRTVWLVEEKEEMTGEDITDAFPQPNLEGLGGMEVILEFGPTGTAEFRNTTRKLVGQPLAIVLDETVYSAPVIREEIPSGTARISGDFSPEEANNLAVVLQAGNLPADVEIIETNVVGPILGRDSIQDSIRAGIIGGLAVLVLVLIYYSFFGLVADLALILNVFLLVAALGAFGATLTLPGIAGIVLIIGMAVDANVLVFERIREEKKTGREKTLASLLSKGYGRAFSAILDGNVTTLITAIVLFQFGTGPIKGFAVTLSLGILISLFTALFVTRVIFDMLAFRGWLKTAPIGKLSIFENTHIPFMNIGLKSVILSAVFIVGGLIAVAMHHGELNMGIEFTGGTELTVAYAEPVSVDKVRAALPQPMRDVIIQPDRTHPGTMFIKVKEDIAGLPELAAQYAEELRARNVPNPSDASVADIMVIALTQNTGTPIQEGGISIRDVQPEVGEEIARQGWWAVVVASFLIVAYLSWRFQFKFAVASLIALIHDVLVTIAVFAILDREFSLPIVAALLTVIGYSLNDTIVVFDRIRENRRLGTMDIAHIVDVSINQTLSRTFMTSGTTLMVLGAQMIWGGPVTFDFVLTLFIGIIAGTYSSIFIASPILVQWEEKARRRATATSTATAR